MDKAASIHTFETYIGFRAADYEVTAKHRAVKSVASIPHYKLYRACLAMLGQLGFKVGEDAYIKKQFPILSPLHDYGKRGVLEFKSDIYPTGFKFEFFQNVVRENKNGGEYDFDKRRKMPYLTGKLFDYAKQRLTAFIAERVGCFYTTADKPTEAAGRLLHNFQTTSFTRSKIQSLSEIEGMMEDYDHRCNSFDRDKKIIKCGEIKYFRDSLTGRLMRGIAYHNINNMWWVITSRYTLRNLASFELFDATPTDYAQRRYKKGKIPAAKQAQLDLLATLSTGQLAKALSRRKPALAHAA
jgi:hypothetical protein